MSREVICPHCLHSVPVDSDGSIPTLASLDDLQTAEFIIPPTICQDEEADAADLIGPPPNATDPLVGGFDLPSRLSEVGHSWSEPISTSSGSDLLRDPTPDSALEAFVPAEPIAPSQSSDMIAEPPRPAWSSVLLKSYASAATVGLIYLLWSGRGGSIATDSSRDVGIPPSAVERTARLKPLAADRTTNIGREITVGSLEILPMDVKRRAVRLLSDGRPEETSDHVLVLRLRCKNLADDITFAPLAPEFVRSSDRGFSDMIITTSSSPIESFPLAVASEKRIDEQSFAPLAPGETRETILVSEPVEKGRVSGSMTWRFRVRVDARQTVLLGVLFNAENVR